MARQMSNACAAWHVAWAVMTNKLTQMDLSSMQLLACKQVVIVRCCASCPPLNCVTLLASRHQNTKGCSKLTAHFIVEILLTHFTSPTAQSTPTLGSGGDVEAVAVSCKDALSHLQHGGLNLIQHRIRILVNNLQEV